MSAPPPASPERGPPSPDSWLALLLHFCLTDPTLHLPLHLHASLLALFEEALQFDEPLYKHLAVALLASTDTSAPSYTIFQLVTTLKELMSCTKFRLHVQEPFFSQLKDGSKSIEGRCAAGVYNSILPGDALLFNNILMVVVKGVKHYSSFREMLEVEGINHVLPGITTIKEGVMIYRRFYAEEKELSSGVLAIHVELLSEDTQPSTIVRTVLKELVTWDVEALRKFVVKAVESD